MYTMPSHTDIVHWATVSKGNMDDDSPVQTLSQEDISLNDQKIDTKIQPPVPQSCYRRAQLAALKITHNKLFQNIPGICVTLELISQTIYSMDWYNHDADIAVICLDLFVALVVTTDCFFRMFAFWTGIKGTKIDDQTEIDNVPSFWMRPKNYLFILAGPVGLLADIITLSTQGALIYGPFCRIFLILALSSVEQLTYKIWCLRTQLGVTALASLALLYFFAFVAHYFFKDDFDQWFGNIFRSMFTLFQIMTLEDWASIARPVMELYPHAWAFFVVFILLFAFVMMNVVTGIVVDGLQGFSLAKNPYDKDSLSRIEYIQNRLREARRQYVDSMATIEELLKQLEKAEDMRQEEIAYRKVFDPAMSSNH